jgi:hypothetical protein
MSANSSPAIDPRLAKCLGEFPITYAAPILIADLSRGGPQFNNGTATLIELESKKLVITCAHVIDKYGENWMEDRRSLFQIDNVRLEPFSQLIAEDRTSDLATIELSEDQIKKLEEGGKRFFLPRKWPPDSATTNDWIALGGFPAPGVNGWRGTR